jgi:hypothetical protein
VSFSRRIPPACGTVSLGKVSRQGLLDHFRALALSSRDEDLLQSIHKVHAHSNRLLVTLVNSKNDLTRGLDLCRLRVERTAVTVVASAQQHEVLRTIWNNQKPE